MNNTYDFVTQAIVEFDRRNPAHSKNYEVLDIFFDNHNAEQIFVVRSVLDYDRAYRATHHGKPPQNLQYQYWGINPLYKSSN